MPVYPGHLKTVIWTHASHEEVRRQLGTGFSYETRGIMFCDHGPTHIDSVSHLCTDPDAPPVDKFPLEYCITSAICLDVSDIPLKTQFGRAKIEAELKRWNLDIRKGDTVLFYTAHYDRYYGQEIHDRLSGPGSGGYGIHHRPGMHQLRRRFPQSGHVV